jgi:hypothetical protein
MAAIPAAANIPMPTPLAIFFGNVDVLIIVNLFRF